MNSPTAAKPGCLSSWEIAQLAEDLLPVEESQTLLSHVSECDVCARALRQAMQDLERPLSASEEQAVMELLAHAPAPPRGVKIRVPHYLWGVAAAVVIAVAAASWYFAFRGDPLLGLLAQASALDRPFDWRLPGGDYGPVHIQRGSGRSVSAALLEARSLLMKRSSSQRSVDFLRHLAWSQLLEGQLESAIRTLEEARQLAPNDIAVSGLLGVAYSAQAEAGEPGSYPRALEEYSRVLEKRAKDPSALYNRALTHMRMGNAERAAEDWRAFLQVETDDGWRREASERLQTEIKP